MGIIIITIINNSTLMCSSINISNPLMIYRYSVMIKLYVVFLFSRYVNISNHYYDTYSYLILISSINMY